MPEAFIPADQDTRRAIIERLDESMVVEAGAGTGKTRSLVDRVVALVTGGHATMDRVAAITFTEAAAAELRERIRQSLEAASADPDRAETERLNCERGVADLDQAAVQTLHSFAGSILRERPLEAGLPPGFETLDEIQADLAFNEQWKAWVDGALDDPELAPYLRRALPLGLSIEDLRGIAIDFHRSYDLLREAKLSGESTPEPHAATALIEAIGELERLCSFAKQGEADPLVVHTREVAGLGRRVESTVEASGPGSVEVYRLLAQASSIRPGNRGNQREWGTDPGTRVNACKQLKELLAGLDDEVRDELGRVRGTSLVPLLRALRDFVLGYSEERRRQGAAEFHDLLVWARDLVRDNLDVRDHFRQRYTHLLIDEMQDTDPLQAEIALFLAEDVPAGTPDDARPRRWTDVRPARGKLFVVGDPKQSIYRFRRADVQLVGRVRRVLGEEPALLSQNFRSQRPVVEWVNHVFNEWMVDGTGQPAYAPLTHRWEPRADHPVRPAVHYLGGALEEGRATQVRRREARDIAALLTRVHSEAWPVLDEEASLEAAEERFRGARLRDVCVLVPRRTGLLDTMSGIGQLELALEDAGIPYRLESAALVFSTQEVRDLLNCLRAIDNPADQVAVVAALRSPALACSDVDLLAFVEAGGRFDYLAAQDVRSGRRASDLHDGDTGDAEGAAGVAETATAARPVLEALAVLRGYHERRMWRQPADLIEEFIRERRLMEAALDHERPRERWRRYRFLVERARAFASSGGTSLRTFLGWAGQQQREGARMPEVPVPEADEDAARVMTVHAAKGLEFPIVVLAGLNGQGGSRAGRVLFGPEEGRVEVRVGSAERGHFQTQGYEERAGEERRQEQEEHVRLMYVAATRARDHLVVSLHRTTGDSRSAAARIPALLEDADHLWQPAMPLAPASSTDRDTWEGQQGGAPDGDTPEAREAWRREREAAFRAQSRPQAVAATALAREAKDEQDHAGEPWRRGRAGTGIGRAVHAVLQTVDLQTGEGLEETARAQAAAEGIADREGEVARLARKALESGIVGRAVASGRYWREVPVFAPVGDGVLEGFIDLLFEEGDGLVVVDYKTDVLASDAEIDAAMGRYRLQGGAYALALERATGKGVKEVAFLFLQPERTVSLVDLPAAVAEVEQAAAAVLSSGQRL